MKIVSKCGEVQIELNLLNTEVKMQVEKMPEELRGKYHVCAPFHQNGGFDLYSSSAPELKAQAVYLRGQNRLDDNRIQKRLFDTVNQAAHYYQRVQDLIESFDSTALTRKRAQPVCSKCGKVKVELTLDGTIVSMKVLEMPEGLRGKHGMSMPMHTAHGLSLCSTIFPQLHRERVFLHGSRRDSDYLIVSIDCDSPADAVDYCDRVKALIETFDSTGLMKKGEKKEWRIVAAPDTVIGMPVYRLYRFQFERWCPVAQSMFYGDAHALAAALNIEVED